MAGYKVRVSMVFVLLPGPFSTRSDRMTTFLWPERWHRPTANERSIKFFDTHPAGMLRRYCGF